MISNLCFLGIHEDAINNAIEKAENLLKIDYYINGNDSYLYYDNTEVQQRESLKFE